MVDSKQISVSRFVMSDVCDGEEGKVGEREFILIPFWVESTDQKFSLSLPMTETAENVKKMIGKKLNVAPNLIDLEEPYFEVVSDLCLENFDHPAQVTVGIPNGDQSSFFPPRLERIESSKSYRNFFGDAPVKLDRTPRPIEADISDGELRPGDMGSCHGSGRSSWSSSRKGLYSPKNSSSSVRSIDEVFGSRAASIINSSRSSVIDTVTYEVGDDEDDLGADVDDDDNEPSEESRHGSAVLIQTIWRAFNARSIAKNIRHRKQERLDRERRIFERQQAEALLLEKREIDRRMNPRNASDFEILYNELENWRIEETERIQSMNISKDERKSRFAALLEKETKLLQSIDKMKFEARTKNREASIRKLFQDMVTRAETEEKMSGDISSSKVSRAMELQCLYQDLTSTGMTVDERLHVLMRLKGAIDGFDSYETREISELVNREADLLDRGRSERTMTGLRKRICTLFLQLIEYADFVGMDEEMSQQQYLENKEST